MTVIRRRWLLGIGALFSGIALLTHILSRIPLPLLFGLTVSLLALTVWKVWHQAVPEERQHLIGLASLGCVSGLLAIIAYDSSKLALSQWDPSPYNPFEAIRVFGTLLVGRDTPVALIQIAGVGFHLVNGISFGVAYCFLFGRRGMLAGIGWGLFLELFQLTLFPGWLDIRSYREFVQISALSHVIYGAVLGSGCRYGLHRLESRRLRADNSD